MRRIKGSPKDWRIDANEDPQLVELEDGVLLEVGVPLEAPSGQRAGEKRSMYLRKADFERYGFTDGCPGCRDIAIGRAGPRSGWAGRVQAAGGLLKPGPAGVGWWKPSKQVTQPDGSSI